MGNSISEIFDRALGDGIQETATVIFGEHARIEHDNDAGIGFAADQTADPLPQHQHGIRDGIILERTAAGSLDPLAAGLVQGMIRDGERQFGDDHVPERIAGDIDTGPETGGAERSVRRCRKTP